MVDLINNSDDCTRWRRKVGEQIDSAENVHQIFVLLNPPYYLTFIKFAASALSEKDLGQLLSTAWTQEECPNQDCNAVSYTHLFDGSAQHECVDSFYVEMQRCIRHKL